MTYVNAAIIGVLTGGAYALVAVSITLMFRSTGVLSFAHAAFASVGAYVYADLAGGNGWPKPLAALVALAATIAYGLLIERLAIRPVRNGTATTKLIATLGVMAFTIGLLLLVYGFQPTSAPLLLPDKLIRIGDLGITLQQLTVLIVAAGLAGGLAVFLKASRFGIAIRAVAQNADSARLMGVSLAQVARFNWALGAGLAGLTGILVAPLAPVTTVTFTLLLAKALTATLFGGLLSLPLAFAGGLAVGVAESISIIRFSAPGSRELVTLFIVVALLVFRRNWASDEVGLAAEVATPSRFDLRKRFAPVLDRGRKAWDAVGPLRLPIAIAVAALCLYAPATSNYWGFVGARALFYVLQALSLVLLVGWGGQVSLMHGAYVGIGAFTTAYFVETHGLPLELALVLGGVSGMALGALVGLPALRLSGLQFAIASLAFSGAATEWLYRRPEFPKLLPRGELFGLDIFQDSNLFLAMVPITLLMYLLVWNMRRSSFGPLLLSSRDAPMTVAHFGADPKRTRMAAFLLASFIASLGGGLYGVLLTGFQPFDFSLMLSISLLLFAVVGGVESLAGPLIAGFFFGVVPQLIQGESGASASAWPDVLSGIAVIALIGARPAGLASFFARRRPAEETEARPARWLGRFDLVVDRRATVNGDGDAVATAGNGHAARPEEVTL
ncbi:MAG TPA: ABC transporter permease [Acidimicrobiales bacterium]|nr:ABC transporter permease [Acidimicrobiales bacterium]